MIENNQDDRKTKPYWRRFNTITLVLTLMIASATSHAQSVVATQGTVYRIGLISYTPAAPDMARLKHGLRRLGYWEGDNVVYMERDGVRNGDPNSGAKQVLEHDVADMVAWHPDLIVSFITTSSLALKANVDVAKIPVVMWGGDPVGSGLVKSRRHPGGNITGFTVQHVHDLLYMRFLKLCIPNLKHIAYMYNASYVNAPGDLKEMQETAALMNLKLTVYYINRLEDFEPSITKMKADGMQAIKLGPHEMFNVNGAEIGRLALKHGLPIVGQESILKGGGLASTGEVRDWALVAPMIDKLLKGANPADMPFERGSPPTMIINMEAASQLGITIPPSVLDQATLR